MTAGATIHAFDRTAIPEITERVERAAEAMGL
jgi:hypothetical protein